MSDTLVALVDDLTAIVKERRLLREENEKLKSELASIKSTFGKSKNNTWSGPRRINRRKLESHDISAIHRYHRQGLKVTEIARMYDVHHGTISRIISGVYHKGAA